MQATQLYPADDVPLSTSIPWRVEVAAAHERDKDAIAFEDANGQVSLEQLQHSASWIARSIWDALKVPRVRSFTSVTEVIEDDVAIDVGSDAPTVAIFVEKSVLCMLSALGALLSNTCLLYTSPSPRDS